MEVDYYVISPVKWVGHNLHRNWPVKHVIEGKRELSTVVIERRRRKQLLHDLKERGRYWKWEEEEVDYILWTACVGRGYGPVVSQIIE
jgi:hypothetical protein